MSQITTHILDISRGAPAVGVPVYFSTWSEGAWTTLGEGRTNSDGRVPDLLPSGDVLPEGRYCMRFDTAHYFEGLGEKPFYPWAEVVFKIPGNGQHYHSTCIIILREAPGSPA